MSSRTNTKPTSALSVNTSQKATQEVHFCNLAKLTPKALAQASPAAKLLSDHRAVVLVDKRVHSLWAEQLESAPILKDAAMLLLPVGEKAKTLPTAETTLRSLSKLRATRNDHYIIAVGGGALLDAAGFIASLYHRGLPIVHVPTTLLAMVDATLGGKTAVNFLGSKNQIGTFHLPVLTLLSLDFLSTLTEEHLRDGLIESVKMAFLSSTRDLDAATHNAAKVLDGDQEAASRLVLAALRNKSVYVRDDMLDQGKRALLNLGHTTGYALEAVYGGRMSHGNAVGNGILVAMELARGIGKLAKRTPALIDEMLTACAFTPLMVQDAKHLSRLLWGSVSVDKKVTGGRCTFVLPLAPGKAELVQVEMETFTEAAVRVFQQPPPVLESPLDDDES